MIPAMASACTLSTVLTQDDIYFCIGQPQTFSCEAPIKKQNSVSHLEWRIDFEHSTSEAVTRQFTSADPEGYILRESRPGVTFEFKVTSNNGSSSLASVMNLTVDNINATALINNATVNCGEEANRKMLHIIEGLSI